MPDHHVFRKNRDFALGVAGTVVEGLLSGSLFMLLYAVMQDLWRGSFNLSRALTLTVVIAVLFLARILIYSAAYTRAQIGGAAVSRNLRLYMGDHLKRIPLARFSQAQTGDYITTITSDVNNYEQILTHKVGDLAKNISLSLMLIAFVMSLNVAAGAVLLLADLLMIPGLWCSFHMVRRYGSEKNAICVENVSSIVEYVSGIQTFRAYGIGGTKNATLIAAMRNFSHVSFLYEAKVLPIGAVYGILSWLACPLVMALCYAPWTEGALDTVTYLLLCMLPLFCAKLANALFIDLTSYKNLRISRQKIDAVLAEPEAVKGYGNSVTLEEDVTDTAQANKILLALCDSVASRMRADGRSCSCVTVTIRGNDFRNKSHQRKLPEPTDVTAEVFALSKTLFSELWDGYTPLRLLGVTLGDVSDNETVQLSMFQDDQKDRARKLDQTVDQLRSKFGVTAISRGSVTDATKRVGRKYKAQLEEDKPK